MKQLRFALALALCVAAAHSSVALAASGDAPSVTLTVPKSAVASGTENSLTVKSSLPGFLTLRLLDAAGNEVVTLLDAEEIHSKENTVSVLLSDEEGAPLSAGAYTVDAVVVSQYGVSSKSATGSLTLEAPAPVQEPEEAAEPEEPEEPEAAKTNDTSNSSSSVSSSSSSSASASPTSVPSSTASTSKAPSTSTSSSSTGTALAYGAGSFAMGEEGYAIGVGVGDTAEQTDAGYWGLTADASDAEIWAAITHQMVSVDVGENESAYIYNSPYDGRTRLGTVNGLSQGLNVIKNRDDGWSLVEAFRNEDGAFVRGYIRTKTLRTVEPNTTYGIVIDKSTQTLTVFKDGKRIGSCEVSTGLATVKYMHRETPAGEYITVTRRGTYDYYGQGYTKYTIRISGSYYLCEIPTTKKNGTDFSLLSDKLGEKATRGSICIAHEASTDGGINAEWIWDMTDENKKVKVLIFDDKPRTDVPTAG